MNKGLNTEIDAVDSYSEDTLSSENSTVNVPDSKNEVTIPNYLKETYYWSYLNPKNVRWLDQEWIVKLILWGQHNKLRRAAFSEINVGESVLQAAAVYGRFSKYLSEHIQNQGRLKIIDVSDVQVKLTKEKLRAYSQSNVVLADACAFQDQPYDVVLCYFLLHEVPDDIKIRVLDNLLRHITPKGKLVIVDYHKPHLLHPIKPITSMVFKYLEPFARTLWNKSFRELTSQPEKYDWQKQNYFGGLFQKVVVTIKTKGN